MPRTKAGYDELMQRIFHDFSATKGDDPIDLDECFEKARADRLWERPRESDRAIFKRDMSRALSRQRITDANGNSIRPNLALRIKRPDGQGYFHFWGEMLRMKPRHVEMSLKQRLLSIAGRAIQLDRDTSYYNENNVHGAQLEFDYNLQPHVENARNPTEYPDERPEDDGKSHPA